jgi:spermidine/putrescine-binding protein
MDAAEWARRQRAGVSHPTHRGETMNTRHRISRIIGLAIGSLILAACAGAAPPVDNLIVLDWAGYELPEFWAPFAEAYPDITVDYSFFAEDAEAYAKLQSGFEADVLHPCSSWWGLYVESGLVQPIDTSRLSNWSGVAADLAEQGQFNGEQYFIPWEWGYESILVRTDLVEQVPDSWTDLWDPQYAGHVALWDSGESNFVMTAVAMGFDPYNTTPEQREQITQRLVEIKPNLLTYWVDYSEMAQLLAAGDLWMASNAWPDAYAILLDEEVPVQYIEPAEGRLGWVCGYGISSTARDLNLAHAFLDALLAPSSMAFLTNEYYYGAANSDSVAEADPYVVDLLDLDDPEVLGRTVFYETLTEEQRDFMTSIWDEVKAAP